MAGNETGDCSKNLKGSTGAKTVCRHLGPAIGVLMTEALSLKYLSLKYSLDRIQTHLVNRDA